MSFVWPTGHVGMLHPAASRPAARERAADFVTFAEAAMTGLSYSDAKRLFTIDHAQVETRKSFLEEVGLLFVPHSSDGLVLTEIGKQLYAHQRDFGGSTKTEDRNKTTSLLAWALSNSQINRPQSPGSPPISSTDRTSCDVRPYSAAWQAVRDLDGILYLHEFLGPLRRLQFVAGYEECIEVIRKGRKAGSSFVSPSEWQSKAPLMNVAIYWKSHLSIAGELLRFDNDLQAFQFAPGCDALVETVLQLQRGCGGSKLSPMTARYWTTVYDYYDDAGGRGCPPFIASGAPIALDIAGLKVTLLSGYLLQRNGMTYVDGGPELCTLQINAPCFHIDNPKSLLRLAEKKELAGGGIRIVLRPGRPILDGTPLFDAWGGTKDAD